MDTSEIGKRMKQYEDVNNLRLIDKLPVVIRLDGVNFHSFTKDMERPFDKIVTKSMQQTMLKLCKAIPGCVFGYTQSDEITLVLADYKNPLSQPWYGYVKRKLESVTASMTTKFFDNSYTSELVNNIDALKENDVDVYGNKIGEAMFDCRAFNLPVHEVVNNLIWRQYDCMRNSVLAVGHMNFSHSELQNKSCNQIKEMLISQKGIDWDKLPTNIRLGSCAIKSETRIPTDKNEDGFIMRDKWEIVNDIPVFSKNKEYINRVIRY